LKQKTILKKYSIKILAKKVTITYYTRFETCTTMDTITGIFKKIYGGDIIVNDKFINPYNIIEYSFY
jgi:hypothetical protein